MPHKHPKQCLFYMVIFSDISTWKSGQGNFVQSCRSVCGSAQCGQDNWWGVWVSKVGIGRVSGLMLAFPDCLNVWFCAMCCYHVMGLIASLSFSVDCSSCVDKSKTKIPFRHSANSVSPNSPLAGWSGSAPWLLFSCSQVTHKIHTITTLNL